MPNPFISVQDVSDLLGRNIAGDPGAYLAIGAACDICRTVAERQFTRGTTTASYDGTGSDALVLGTLPVLNAGTVTVSGGTITDYMLTTNGVLLRGTAGADPRPVWPSGRQNVSVTFEHGYDTLNIPEDVRQVAINIATRIAVQGVASEEQIGDVRIKYSAAAADLTAGEKLILNKYRPR
jgi:hypothetical protein